MTELGSSVKYGARIAFDATDEVLTIVESM
jgi:hypothetical protein